MSHRGGDRGAIGVEGPSRTNAGVARDNNCVCRGVRQRGEAEEGCRGVRQRKVAEGDAEGESRGEEERRRRGGGEGQGVNTYNLSQW